MARALVQLQCVPKGFTPKTIVKVFDLFQNQV